MIIQIKLEQAKPNNIPCNGFWNDLFDIPANINMMVNNVAVPIPGCSFKFLKYSFIIKILLLCNCYKPHV